MEVTITTCVQLQLQHGQLQAGLDGLTVSSATLADFSLKRRLTNSPDWT